MRMLHALSGDKIYLESIDFMKQDGGKRMCDWAEALKNEGRLEGRQEGRQEGRGEGLQAAVSICREFGMTFEVTLAKIMEKFSLGAEEAREKVEMYW